MATLASPRYRPDEAAAFAPPRPRLVSNDPGHQQPVAQQPGDRQPFVRSVYQPSRQSGPVAVLASAGVILAAMAALATLDIVAQHKSVSRLTVVETKQLDITPPPPPPPPLPPKSLEKPVEQQPQAFIPKPMIELPAPGPTQVALDLPPPVAAPAAVAPRIVAPVGPAVSAAPAASSDPVEGGDLSSQVLFAKPPAYPIDARRRRVQGTVKLLVLVGPDGRVSDIRISGSSGSDLLDRAALGAVRHWRWAPQKKNGVAVAVRGFVPVTFALSPT